MKQIKCPSCRKKPALLHPALGVLPCESCKNRHSQNPLPRQYEVVTESLRSERREYAKSAIQPFRDGVLSKEYLDTYGDKAINVTEEQKKNARPVWDDIYSKNFDIKKTK